MTGQHQRREPQQEKKNDMTSPLNIPETAPLNREHKRLLKWLCNVKFRRALFGGVDETDVWKKIEELNGLYEAALRAERARYDALLEANVLHSNEIFPKSTGPPQRAYGKVTKDDISLKNDAGEQDCDG